ncbi:ATP-dependent DNA helicase RecG [Patescibacteria group bacterium]|nr:ATP-dependent DNA helicase RecG [Patescibacteria group bacterium]MBU4337947.1 ATP-dependent DNA helicase RecG [Patescibacteria group bacterium]MBU4580091.1 ATP-dependent DNA helicase RecG [Patescibacteria group bacterium]
MPYSLNSLLSDTGFITPYYLKKFQKLGINTIEDLILYFPRRYNDFTNLMPIANLSAGQVATIQGKILKIKSISIFRRHINITEAIIEDDSGSIKAIWFNQPYLAKLLEEGTAVSLSGKIERYKKGIQISNPMYEKMDALGDLTHTGRLVPVYSETAGLTSRYIRNLIKKFLPIGKETRDILPLFIIKKYNFLSYFEAVSEIHFPENKESLERARHRLAFEELFIIQLASIRQKRAWQKQKANSIIFDKELIRKFVKSLPFKLTNGQRMAAWEILKDLEKNYPMNRLLLGDVGSGKTAVAFIAALETAAKGFQTAFMAPTEILASQHFISAIKTFKAENLTIGLFTGSVAKIYSENAGISREITKSAMLEKIANGQVEILIGTHALIQKEVNFKRLGLVIIDEQHRFGTRQRGQFLFNVKKHSQVEEDGFIKFDKMPALMPHIMSMSATPIPRTLALAFYGTMDISRIDEMPLGRKKITTKIVSPENRIKAYDFIRRQIQKGHQAFIVCPRVEGSDMSETRAATKEFKRLAEKEFKGLALGLLHGRLKSDIKERAIRDFADGKIKIIVSTSVVEVGVDVPRATVMMIEGAEHFGLAELHQFRGRVGRGTAESYCFLFTDSASEETLERLAVMEKSSDGFKLAAEDLKHRGPGEFLGIGQIQSGFPMLKVASLFDEKLLKNAHEEAKKILDSDFELKSYLLISQKLAEYKGKAVEK